MSLRPAIILDNPCPSFKGNELIDDGCCWKWISVLTAVFTGLDEASSVAVSKVDYLSSIILFINNTESHATRMVVGY